MTSSMRASAGVVEPVGHGDDRSFATRIVGFEHIDAIEDRVE